MKIFSGIPSRKSLRTVPEYLYHFTNKYGYDAIMRDGFIRQSSDSLLNKGAVFTVEKSNYFNQWATTKIDDDTLKDMLVKHIDTDREAFVLRIPTKNLKYKKLFVRNQKKYFDFKHGDYDKLPKNPIKLLSDIVDCLHLRFGTPAFLSKFHKKNAAYEYIYKSRINAEDIDLVMPLKEFLSSPI